jgi:serine protease
MRKFLLLISFGAGLLSINPGLILSMDTDLEGKAAPPMELSREAVHPMESGYLPDSALPMEHAVKAALPMAAGHLPDSVPSGLSKSSLSYRAYELLNLPDLKLHEKTVSYSGDPVIIAVVDDGFRLTHKEMTEFVYTNPLERSGNGIDDDGNGKVDDIHGWDVSDNDSNVSPPAGQEEEWFHGTMISSAVITVLKYCFGEAAAGKFRILPVKVLSDYAGVPFLKEGYEGIEYAIDQGADIICCAWSGGEPGERERAVIKRAIDAGITVIGSAGNYYTEKVDAPASLDGVLAVAGIDTLFRKTTESNYGERVDLVAPAANIRTAHALADNAYFYGSGTSGAAGLVTGCMAVLKALQPESTPGERYNALVNTARPVDSINLSYGGKLGAGIPDLTAAADYLLHEERRSGYFNAHRTKGAVFLEGQSGSKTYAITPAGAFSGFNFMIKTGKRSSPKQTLSFYTGDSLFYYAEVPDLPAKLFIPGSAIRMEYSGTNRFSKFPLELTYSALPIDSSTLYCSGTSHYALDSAILTDGSGDAPYANNSSCKWQITVEEGTRVQIEFPEFDTEPGVDFVYLFDGESTIPGNMIARFSGPDKPPVVTSRTNSVLVWFVTDGRKQGQGWKLRYSKTDLVTHGRHNGEETELVEF